MIGFAAEAPLRSAPGTRVSYHRFAYTLLGVIVEEIAQKSFATFLQDRVFAPLGMASTRFGDSEAVVPRRAPAYARTSDELRTSIYSFGFGNPGAGLNSSSADLAALMAALDSRTVLSRGSLDAMWTPAVLVDGTAQTFGLGWVVGRHAGRTVVGHEGGGAAWVAHFPAERLSIVILCNLNGARADEMQYGIADLFLTPLQP
jgi:CubicO group peptidase (beta-lactamase class C family)